MRWTTAASVNGARKNIRAKIRQALGYDWKQIMAVDMVFGPIKKETYLGIYTKPKQDQTVENVAKDIQKGKPEETATSESAAAQEKEENEMNNPYEEMAAMQITKPDTLVFDVKLKYKEKLFTVKRKITVAKDNGLYHGYVYHSNGAYLGHWYWNTKYLSPVVNPKEDIGAENKNRYEVAIRMALKKFGIYSTYMPGYADRYSQSLFNEAV